MAIIRTQSQQQSNQVPSGPLGLPDYGFKHNRRDIAAVNRANQTLLATSNPQLQNSNYLFPDRSISLNKIDATFPAQYDAVVTRDHVLGTTLVNWNGNTYYSIGELIEEASLKNVGTFSIFIQPGIYNEKSWIVGSGISDLKISGAGKTNTLINFENGHAIVASIAIIYLESLALKISDSPITLALAFLNATNCVFDTNYFNPATGSSTLVAGAFASVDASFCTFSGSDSGFYSLGANGLFVSTALNFTNCVIESYCIASSGSLSSMNFVDSKATINTGSGGFILSSESSIVDSVIEGGVYAIQFTAGASLDISGSTIDILSATNDSAIINIENSFLGSISIAPSPAITIATLKCENLEISGAISLLNVSATFNSCVFTSSSTMTINANTTLSVNDCTIQRNVFFIFTVTSISSMAITGNAFTTTATIALPANTTNCTILLNRFAGTTIITQGSGTNTRLTFGDNIGTNVDVTLTDISIGSFSKNKVRTITLGDLTNVSVNENYFTVNSVIGDLTGSEVIGNVSDTPDNLTCGDVSQSTFAANRFALLTAATFDAAVVNGNTLNALNVQGASSRSVISGNRIGTSSNSAITIGDIAENTIISDNQVASTATTSAGKVINLKSVNRGSISNNIIRGGGNGSYGIYIDGNIGTADDSNGCVLNGNRIRFDDAATGGEAIYVTGDCADSIVTDNILASGDATTYYCFTVVGTISESIVTDNRCKRGASAVPFNFGASVNNFIGAQGVGQPNLTG